MTVTFKQFLVEDANIVAARDLDLTSKPVDWHDVHDHISQRDHDRAGFKKLPEYHCDDVWVCDHEHRLPKPTQKFHHTPKEKVFILDVPGEGKFLINTEGYDYVRYAAKLG